ncbi:MAG: hypothetical protein HY811_02300 [Planctomycetes bacterium]|nr:hypothetical protein [Planctomycetota bacterium]
MRALNITMWVIRLGAILIILFCLFALLTDRTELLKKMADYFVPFILVYFVGSIFQMYLRYRNAGRYPPPAGEVGPELNPDDEKGCPK